MDEKKQKPSIISISSHVTRGSVGNRAAVFAFEAFGFPVWAIQTVLLPWHPGHGIAKRIIPTDSDFDEFLSEITNSPAINEVGAVLTGYIASVSQVHAIAQMISILKFRDSNLIYMCDPVIGDNGSLYVQKEIAEAIRDNLLPLADLITPNAYELAWLTNKNAPTIVEEVVELTSSLQAPAKLITSAPMSSNVQTGSLYLDEKEAWLVRHSKIINPPNGLGDLTSSTFLARKMMGIANSDNLRNTTESILEILTHSAAQKSNELTLESNVASLLQPRIEIPLTNLELLK